MSIVAVSAIVGCQPSSTTEAEGDNTKPESANAWFTEVTKRAGLDFVHDPGPTTSYFMPQSMGSGAALFDFDQDGRLDIYLLQGAGPQGPPNRLYHQEADGTFRDASRGSGLDVSGFATGVAVGDVNNDGLPDVFLAEYGRIRLLLNRGQGKFADISREAGIESLLWATSASFLDYDRDGWLDLVVTNYVAYDPTRPCYGAAGERDFCSPTQFDGTPTLLFRNATRAADTVRFEDVSTSSGVGKLPGPGLGVVCADFNDDRWDDIFIANDQEPNRLWINQHDGTFQDEALVRGVALNALGRAGASMGTAWGDIDDDGLVDLFVTKLDTETHTLWRQGPAGLFKDDTADAGLARATRSTGFGVGLGDFDLDGDLDLAFVNGRVFAGKPAEGAKVPSFWRAYAERNSLFENDGHGVFQSIAPSNAPFCGTAEVGRSLCAGDIDNDGALDMLITTTAGPARIYLNTAVRKGHWLTVRATDPALKRDAYGAVVTVKADKRAWRRLVNPGTSYQCSHDPRVHFGLGEASRFDELRVRWPDGSDEVFGGGTADRLITIRKGEGRPP